MDATIGGIQKNMSSTQHSSGTDDPAIEFLLDEICESFSEIRSRMDRHDDFMATSKMEEFANATTKAFGEGDAERGVEYLKFMSNRLNPNNPREYEYIDIYYVENLFWPHGTQAAKRGWPFVPDNLKKLFIAFHGKTPL